MKIDYETPKRAFLQYIVHVLFKRKGLIVWSFFVVFVAMELAKELSYPVYLATAKIWVHKSSSQILSFMPDVQVPPINLSPITAGVNWIEFLNGQQLAMKVVEEFHLDEFYRSRVSDPQTFRDKFWVGFMALFNYPVQFMVDMGLMSPAKEKDYFLQATQNVQKDMESINLVGLQTEILTISIYGPTPKLAQDIANFMSQALIDRVVAVEQNAARYALGYANRHIDEISDNLQRAEQALTDHEKESGVLEISQQKLLQVQRSDNLKNQIETLEANREKLLRKREVLEKQVEWQRKGGFVSHALLQADVAQLSKLDVDLAVGEKNLEIVRQQYQDALGRARELIQAEFVDRKLEREVRTYNTMWSLFQDKIAKLRIETASRLKEISMEVIDEAYVSENDKPLWPRGRDIDTLAILGGLSLGLFLAFIIEYFNEGMRTKKEVEEELQLPVLASVPEFTLRRKT